ncbi:MAG: long-chain fatty acid--CoA ligase, partial [Burkholderiales bacterium]
KDVGKLTDGTLFAPQFLENKLKFFPYIKEAVCFGDKRDMVCAFVNIDVQAVGNWAEKRGLAYAGYVDLAAKPEVYALIEECVEKVNADLAREPHLDGSQIRRFLVLHKELDADDDELTRTRKVRRGFIGEKYAPLVTALYGAAASCRIETQVRFEDGRTGSIRAEVRVRDVKTSRYATAKTAA